MATGKISKRSIDALRPNASNQFLWDTDLKGFGAKITPAGAISYVLQFRMGGREASAIERGLQNATLLSVWEIAQALEVRPVALLEEPDCSAPLSEC